MVLSIRPRFTLNAILTRRKNQTVIFTLLCFTLLQSSGAEVAIKQMTLSRQPKPEVLINEINLMRSCQHPAIVMYYDSFLVGGGKSAQIPIACNG